VKILDLTGGSPIKISSGIENDEGEKKGEEEGEEEDNGGFMRIKDLEAAPRRPPLKQSLRYIVDTSSDEEAPLKRPRRSSYARKAPKKSL
jgi:hypothetical protein